MSIKKILIIILALLPSISNSMQIDVSTARNSSFPDNSYRETLRQGYLKFYDSAVQSDDRDKAFLYGRKALATAKGLIPEIEGVSNRNIPLNRLNSLLGSKYFLESAFATGTRESTPEVSAHAQLMFDCWVEQEEGVMTGRGSVVSNINCQEEFLKLEHGLRLEIDKIKRAYQSITSSTPLMQKKN